MVAVGGAGAASLRLDADALAHVRLSPTWGPFSESLFSLPLLWQRPPNPVVRAWQHAVRARLDDWIAPLHLLARARPLIDLHTIVGSTPDLEGALEALASAPPDQLGAELEPVRRATAGSAASVQVWLRDLAHGEAHAHEVLADLLRRYHRCAVAPYWEAIRNHLDAEHARRGQILARGGVDELLGSLHPRIRWGPPSVLDVHAPQGTGDAGSAHALGGRPLVLVPSAFCVDGPHLLTSSADSASPYVLVYPALREMCDAASLWTPGAAPTATALAKLLGSTRAKTLRAVAETRATPTTTTGLARRLRVSPATASHHVGVLRDARLITSRRTGNEVVHRVASLGAALLAGTCARPEGTEDRTPEDRRSDVPGQLFRC